MSDTPEEATYKKILAPFQDSKTIFLTTTGPRDTGQSDYKNRHTFSDLIQLAPYYERAGYFSVEMHGGARFHQDMLSNMINPFEEAEAWKASLKNTFTQTLVRSTNVWGYRAYPQQVIREAVKAFVPSIDIWRCFDFLNYVKNMQPIAEEIQKGGKMFQPAISFTQSPECTNEYYLKVAREMVALVGGEKNTILCIKDMAGVGSPARISSLIDSILQVFPDLVIQLHRHNTDGLTLPALLAAAKAGARIFDVTEDSFVRYYGQAPVRPFAALLRENGFDVRLNDAPIDEACDIIRDFLPLYEPFESQFRGPSYDVLKHRMPGGAFPSSFEQAEKGGFLHLMPWILKGMSLGNQIIKYFDVTPGSQITWTTWAGIIQRRYQEGGEERVVQLLELVERFINGGQKLETLNDEERKRLCRLYETAADDLRKLLLGEYGPLPFGWPANWVYRSAFGADKWEDAIRKRDKGVPPPADVDLEAERAKLAEELDRPATDKELVLYLQHPAAAVRLLKFRQKFGDTSILPTRAWLYGLSREHPSVEFFINEKPHEIRLVSIGHETDDGKIWVVLAINNTLMDFPIDSPKAASTAVQQIQLADPGNPQQIAAPMNGNLWRIGSSKRKLKEGVFVEKGEEIANIEVMKTENALFAPFDGKVKKIHAGLNDPIVEGQLLFEIVPREESPDEPVPTLFPNLEAEEGA